MGKTLRVLALVLWFSFFLWLGWSTAATTIAAAASGSMAASLDLGEPRLVTFRHILSRNLIICTLLVAGAATGGLLTLYQTAVIALTLGIDIGLSLSAFGPQWTMRALVAHAPLELAGFGLAAYTGLSGFRDIIDFVARTKVEWNVLTRYIRPALIASGLIVLAAVLETWVTPLLL